MMTMPKPQLVPTQYRLSGDHAAIEYATTSFAGRPTFDYKAGQTHVTVSGDQIRVIESEFGTLVTITIETTADAGDTTLTLLIPAITVTQQEPSAKFETKAVVMSLRRLGQVHQFYRILNLRGTAEFVVF